MVGHVTWEVAVRKKCASCGKPFEAKRATAKYCGDRCRQRKHRKPDAPSELPAPVDIGVTAGVTATTQAALERADRADSPAGQAALALARRIDAGSAETGSALASMVRQHGVTLAEALRNATIEADPVDELRARRDRKLAN
jgi:hypothetical protein